MTSRCRVALVAMLILALTWTTPVPGAAQGEQAIWDTAEGQACFERWIAESMRLLNAFNGGQEFNARKPWSINKYGVLEGNARIGPRSVGAPDDFPRVNYNKYWWMWEHYPAPATEFWESPDWRGAGVPALRPFVQSCYDQTKATSGGPPPVSPTGPAGGPTLPPPFGTQEPATVARMTIQAGQRRVIAGELVTIPVYLLRAADVANVNFSLGYESAVARPEGAVQRGNLLGNAIFSANANETDLVLAGFAQTGGLNGTGTVAYIPFRAVGKAGDRTELRIEVTTINNPGGAVLGIERIDGAIQIVGPDGLVPGDCNGDGALNELDALCALQMSVRLIPTQLVLDLDTDRQVTSRDSVLILQRAIGRV